MSGQLVGALLGLAAAVGLLVAVLAAPPLRRPTLEDRVGPYLRDEPQGSRLLAAGAGSGLTSGVLGPALARGAIWIDRLVGGRRSVQRRLVALGSDQTVEDVRLEQVLWGGVGLLAGVLLSAAYAAALARVSVLACLALCLGGLLGGVLARDWRLSSQVRRREEQIVEEFPVVAELLALAVTAGEGPVGALERVCRLSGGELARELSGALAQARSGSTLVRALEMLAERTTVEPLARFVEGVVIAIERGTPLADVLRAQAGDVRAAGKRALLESGGRKEVAMMAPVVFLILPVTVLFALFPGLISIVRLAQ